MIHNNVEVSSQKGYYLIKGRLYIVSPFHFSIQFLERESRAVGGRYARCATAHPIFCSLFHLRPFFDQNTLDECTIGTPNTHIMFYKERFIRNAFLTSQIFKDFKEQTSQFQKN